MNVKVIHWCDWNDFYFILEGKTWLTWYYHRVTIFWFPKKRTLGPVSVCLSECVCAKHSHLPCSANRAPSSSSLLLLAAQSSSRISRRRLIACSQSTSGSWLGPSSTAFSASASNCCTADLDTFSPTFLFQPNDAILYEKKKRNTTRGGGGHLSYICSISALITTESSTKKCTLLLILLWAQVWPAFAI